MLMITKIIIFLVIFTVGEIIMNLTFFKYLKNYFSLSEVDIEKENKTHKAFLLFPISIFKGLLERFVLYVCLVLGLTQILIVFGAIKIGTRIDKNVEIKNDYFLIGNFSSILTSVFYFKLFIWILKYFA